MSMFDHATAVADRRHRAFFDRAGEVRQVWAQRTDGTSFYLADGGVDDEVRADAHAGELSCPYPGCPDRRFIAKGGVERRHHFAHHVAGQDHRRSPAWRHQALLMLADWSQRRYPHLEVELDDREDNDSLRLYSPRADRLVRLTVTYDRRYQLSAAAPGAQILVGHSRALLLPRKEVEGPPGHCWCGEGRLVGDLVARRGWALAINPQERLIATVTTEDLGRAATGVQGRADGLLLCVVAELDDARLDGDGLHTAVSDAVDRELERRRAAKAAEAVRRRAAEAAGLERRRALEADLERQRRDAQTRARAGQARERQRRGSPAAPSPSDPRPPTRAAVRDALVESDSWPTDLQALRRLLDDAELATRLEQPLSTDVMCDVESAIWHLMAVLEWRRRGGDAHPNAVRAAIVMNGCGYSLTGDAIAAVLAVARTRE
jgi:hypothetical protein